MKCHEHCKKKLYFKSGKSKYEKYINKKWVEQKDLFESKKAFRARGSVEWKGSRDAKPEKFLDVSETAAYKMSIKHFFC